ncbi:hypothetical protein TL16_g10950 [Triparma laevis f. inornata]|uniref:Dynamin N-terminal domain-containing protein n=2 Tax=Triparma laevis TaxID=1534972 RepID=A0A9W7ED09_9STRA|nr:hypothetical protein TrLO_g23 [Triparma laevis f. longispina]GMH87734.1 hypothetical protein TL16_g10950 [Triparma laevis f. inornata]
MTAITLLEECRALHESLDLSIAGQTSFQSNSLSLSMDTTFSCVVAGEFNSGKTTFINALLGAELLKSGPLPTTDQICLIQTASLPNPYLNTEPTVHASATDPNDINLMSFTVTHAYGDTNELLDDLQLIDTPGTNAVEELGHEALTRRLLPEADLIIFVTSAEQAISESERQLLAVIKTWKKPVVVILNKVDVLTPAELLEVKSFVEKRVQQIFESNDTEIIEVSSRTALTAKKRAAEKNSNLSADREYKASNFGALEVRLQELLSDEAKVQNKLMSPIGVAESLLNEVDKVLKNKAKALQDDKTTLNLLNQNKEMWEATLTHDKTQLQKALGSQLLQISEDELIIISQVSLYDLLIAEISAAPTLDYEVLSTKLEGRVKNVVGKAVGRLGEKGRGQSTNIIDFLNRRPLNLDQSILASTSMNASTLDHNAMGARVLEDFADLGGFSELSKAMRKEQAFVTGLLRGAFGVGAIGVLIPLVNLTSMTSFDPLLGIGLGAGLALSGAGAAMRVRSGLTATFNAGYERVQERLSKRVLANFEVETEFLKEGIDSQITPFTKYVEAAIKNNEGRLDGSNELKTKLTKTRFEILENRSEFLGGFRSER